MRVLAQAPCRLGLFGGSTDVPPYCTEYGGVCINLAINIRQQVIVNDEGEWSLQPYDNKAFFDAMLGDVTLGVEHSFTNGIEGGIGSSAALAVALTGAVSKVKRKPMPPYLVAETAREIECNQLGMFTGYQDQYASAFGGGNVMRFGKTVTVEQLDKPCIQFLAEKLALFHVGYNRQSSKILNLYKEMTPQRKKAMDEIKYLAELALPAVKKGDIPVLVGLMKTAWEAKKASNPLVSNDQIDEIYEFALKHGALAGKLVGAGQGGHMLFLTEDKSQLITAMEGRGLKWADFSPDFQGLDVRVL